MHLGGNNCCVPLSINKASNHIILFYFQWVKLCISHSGLLLLKCCAISIWWNLPFSAFDVTSISMVKTIISCQCPPLRLFIVCDQLIKRHFRPKNIHSALTDSVITTQQWNSQKLFQYQETRLNYSSFWYDIDTESSFNCFSMWLWLLIFGTSKLNRSLTWSLKL